jgi:hypothetical protein
VFILPDCTPTTVTDNFNDTLLLLLLMMTTTTLMTATFVFP